MTCWSQCLVKAQLNYTFFPVVIVFLFFTYSWHTFYLQSLPYSTCQPCCRQSLFISSSCPFYRHATWLSHGAWMNIRQVTNYSDRNHQSTPYYSIKCSWSLVAVKRTITNVSVGQCGSVSLQEKHCNCKIIADTECRLLQTHSNGNWITPMAIIYYEWCSWG